MDVTTRWSVEGVLAVANTWHGPGGHRGVRAGADEPTHDHLREPADARQFLGSHGIDVPPEDPNPGDLVILRAIRSFARGLAAGPEPDWPDDLRGMLDAAAYRLTPGRALEARSAGWSAVCADLLAALPEAIAARSQLKVCANPLCRFQFLDRSRNGSRTWCEMAVCGNRARVGRFRHRHRSATGPRPDR